MNRNNDLEEYKPLQSPLPYPEIKVSGPNPYYAEILMNDYAGKVSELTAINQYLYHSNVINPENTYLIKLLRGISLNEMEHLQILAELIYLLGGNPLYKSNSSFSDNYWKGSFVYYGNNIIDQLQVDLESEYKAIDGYNDDISQINDPYIKKILERIIIDEEYHITLFKDAINKYCYNQKEK